MRFVLSLFIASQMILAPAIARTGERGEFNTGDYLTKAISEVEAESFYKSVKSQMERFNERGVQDFVAKADVSFLSDGDKKTLKNLVGSYASEKIKFTETAPGVWVFKNHSSKVVISVTDLYQGRILVNDKVFDFKGVPLDQFEKKLSLYEKSTKTSWIRFIFNKSIGIESAEATSGIAITLIIAAFIGVFFYGTYKFNNGPEEVLKKVNEMKKKMDQDGALCEEAPSSEESYKKTFDLASSIGSRSTFESAVSPESLLELSIQKKLISGENVPGDCYSAVHEVGKKIDVDIPLVSAAQREQMEMLSVNDRDIKGAVYQLCQSYNKLTSCMSTFVFAHVDNSEVTSFKNLAIKSHRGFKRAVGSGANRQ